MKDYRALSVSYTNNKHKIRFIKKNFRKLKNKEILVKIKYSYINYKMPYLLLEKKLLGTQI